MALEGMTVKQTMKLKILELSCKRANSLKCCWKLRLGRKKCFIHLGRVAQSMVSASHWLRGIETYTILWYLTLVSANHASETLT